MRTPAAEILRRYDNMHPDHLYGERGRWKLCHEVADGKRFNQHVYAFLWHEADKRIKRNEFREKVLG